MKKLLTYLGILVLGILIGRFLIPEPVVEATVEQIESQTGMMDELNRLMEMTMDDYDKSVDYNEEAIDGK